MVRPVRLKPREYVEVWPDEPSTYAPAEAVRRFALNLQRAIDGQSIRAVQRATDVDHITIANVLNGRSWPEVETILKLEAGLQVELLPRFSPESSTDNAQSASTNLDGLLHVRE